MNDIANLCDLIGADINEVRKGIGTDPRIGNKFLYAGIGYGGACFPKDVKALINTGKQYGHDLNLLKTVEEINQKQKLVLFNKLHKAFNGDLKNKNIAIWGLTFKPQTDDMREAPSRVIIDALHKAGAQVRAYDPVGIPEAQKCISAPVTYCNDEYEALQDADALMLITEWREFRLPDWDRVKQLMRNHLILDGRNIYPQKELVDLGFQYQGIGVKSI